MSYTADSLPVGGPDTAMTDQQRASQAPNQEPIGGARGQRFENQLRRMVDSATRPITVLGSGPATTVEARIALTIDEARAVADVLQEAREVVRTRGAGRLAGKLARLDQASPHG